MSNLFEKQLKLSRKIHVQQVLEGFEIALGIETRNKYRILDENKKPLAYAAEAKSGLAGTLVRWYFRHWRSFEITIYNNTKEEILNASFPFRWFFKTLYLTDVNGKSLGHIQQRFSFLRKKFDLYDNMGRMFATIDSPFFKIWTFEMKLGHRKLGTIQKKWTGILNEAFTDRDNFIITYAERDLPIESKELMLACCLMIDIVYFENKKG